MLVVKVSAMFVEKHDTFRQTFEKFLAGVLLEEGFMGDGSVEVVDH